MHASLASTGKILMWTTLRVVLICSLWTPLLGQSKIHLHLDRDVYTVGDDLFYKAYHFDEFRSGERSDTATLFVELVGPDSSIVQTQKLRMIEGLGHGDMRIGVDAQSGSYTIRAYTFTPQGGAVLAFFEQSISVYGSQPMPTSANAPHNVSVRFFPSGGYLVRGLPMLLGIRAEDMTGKGKPISGTIYTTADQSAPIDFYTDSAGFGHVNIQVLDSALLHGHFKFEGQRLELDFPTCLDKGFALEATVGEESVQIQASSSTASQLQGCRVQLSQEGKLIQEFPLEAEGPQVQMEVSTSDLPAGLLVITLSDAQSRAVAEVVVFHYDDMLDHFVEITLEDDVYTRGDSFAVLIECFDLDGEAVLVDASLSIADVDYQSSTRNSLSSLYLESELDVVLDDPARYFTEELATNASRMRDMLLCFGWRRLTWVGERTGTAARGLTLAGRISSRNQSDKGIAATGFLTDLSMDFTMIPFQTDPMGNFRLENLELYGPRNLMIQAAKGDYRETKRGTDELKLRGNRNVDITIFSEVQPSLPQRSAAHVFAPSTLPYLTDNAQVVTQAMEEWDGLSVTIDTIQVRAARIDPIIEVHADGMLYRRPNQRIMLAQEMGLQRYRSIFDIIRARVPGAQITGLTGFAESSPRYGQTAQGAQELGPRVILRAATSSMSSSTIASTAARFLLNGMLVSSTTILSLDPSRVAFIDVIKDLSQLAAYGELGSGGIVAIYLKEGGESITETPDDPGVLHFTYDGYYQAREFYQTRSTSAHALDESVTMLWEPYLRIGSEGAAGVARGSHRLGGFLIKVEGITDQGKPVYGQKFILIEDE
ncbi:MAG: hypothetical protein KTR24_07340 [Saprospiraceae bacterium]|nr:hypothetical protein [Saprospiraceae bacterium]